MNRKVKLPDDFINYLINHPETGMGYHIVNITLNDETILYNRNVVNSTYLLLLENEQINSCEFKKIEISKV